MSPEPTYYELLGLQETASQSEIKTAFRHQVMRNHPDQGGNPVFFRMLEDAYEVLISPTRRSEYDALLNGEIHTPPHGIPPVPPDGDETFAGPQPQWQPRAASPAWQNMFAARSFRRVLVAAILAWLAIASIAGVPAIPGLGHADAIWLVVYAILAWWMGSFALRFCGWATAIFALVDAHWNNASAGVTAARIGVAFGLWLCGHWFYTWRKGTWHSILAHSLLTRLPLFMRPDRRWEMT